MRVSRVYIEGTMASDQTVELDRELSHYLGVVLRLKAGSEVRAFNSEAGEYLARLEVRNRQSLSLVIGDRIATPEIPALKIRLLLGLSRGDRMDLAVQKSTELGVTRITPFSSAFGEVRFKQAARLDKRMRHWRRVAISACEQCGRIVPPVIDLPCELSAALSTRGDATGLILDPTGKTSLTQLELADELCLVTGPEGGFSEAELESARQSGFAVARLGPRILRAETAPLAALAIVQSRFGDLV